MTGPTPHTAAVVPVQLLLKLGQRARGQPTEVIHHHSRLLSSSSSSSSSSCAVHAAATRVAGRVVQGLEFGLFSSSSSLGVEVGG